MPSFVETMKKYSLVGYLLVILGVIAVGFWSLSVRLEVVESVRRLSLRQDSLQRFVIERAVSDSLAQYARALERARIDAEIQLNRQKADVLIQTAIIRKANINACKRENVLRFAERRAAYERYKFFHSLQRISTAPNVRLEDFIKRMTALENSELRLYKDLYRINCEKVFPAIVE